MPTADRKPRPRLRPAQAAPDDHVTILRAMRAAGRDPAAWDALRARAIRRFVAEGMKPEVAGRVFEAFRRKPIYLPGESPADANP
ncbi:MAG: hypothetical protein KJ011_01760 [Burkholderiaceae bacterium]|nr:hypothetical protein [Burkholderiaceae bacterium]